MVPSPVDRRGFILTDGIVALTKHFHLVLAGAQALEGFEPTPSLAREDQSCV